MNELIAAILGSTDLPESLELAAMAAERLAREGRPDLDLANLSTALRHRDGPICRYVASGALDAESAVGLAIALAAYQATGRQDMQSGIAEGLFAASGDLSAVEIGHFLTRLERATTHTPGETESVLYWIERHWRGEGTPEVVGRLRRVIAAHNPELSERLRSLEGRLTKKGSSHSR